MSGWTAFCLLAVLASHASAQQSYPVSSVADIQAALVAAAKAGGGQSGQPYVVLASSKPSYVLDAPLTLPDAANGTYNFLDIRATVTGNAGAQLQLQCGAAASAVVVQSMGVSLTNFAFSGCKQTAVVVNPYPTRPQDLPYGNAITTVRNCAFTGNTGVNGGGVGFLGGDGAVLGCSFTNNGATQGAGVYFAGTANRTNVLYNVTGSTFTGNGRTSVGGSALFMSAGACFKSIAGNKFSGNRGANGGALYVAQLSDNCGNYAVTTNVGGSVGVVQALSLAGNQYVTNSAGTDGGAVFLQQAGSYQYVSLDARGSTFRGNQAGRWGGGIYADISGPLYVSQSTFAGNAAGWAGGAGYVTSLGFGTLNATGVVATGNVVGGSFAVPGPGPSNSSTVNGTYGSGGAFAAVGGMQVSLSNASFTNNTALQQGGALYCRGCTGTQAAGTTFTDNLAAAAGGAVALEALTGTSAWTGCGFYNNAASGQNKSDVGLGPCSIGGGGAMCVQLLTASFSLTNAVVAGNTALFGGGIFLEQSVCLAQGTGCSFTPSNVSLVRNTAEKEGGGIYFSQVQGTAAAALAMLTKGASGGSPAPYILQGNSVVQGVSPNYASRASQFGKLVVPENNVTNMEYFSFNFTMLDGFGQSLKYSDIPIAISVTSSDVIVIAPINMVTMTQVSFSNVSIFGALGFHTLTVVAQADGVQLNQTNFQMYIRPCIIGEVSFLSLCRSCSSDFNSSFSFDPHNDTCDACPADAVCGSALLVPDPDYWQSNPRSPQIHKCPFQNACSYNNRSAALDAWQTNRTSTRVFDIASVDQYQQLECAPGYTGNVCGACEEGYGLVRNRCEQCPERYALAVYILARIMDVVIIGGMVLFRLKRKVESTADAAARFHEVPPEIAIGRDAEVKDVMMQPAGLVDLSGGPRSTAGSSASDNLQPSDVTVVRDARIAGQPHGRKLRKLSDGKDATAMVEPISPSHKLLLATGPTSGGTSNVARTPLSMLLPRSTYTYLSRSAKEQSKAQSDKETLIQLSLVPGSFLRELRRGASSVSDAAVMLEAIVIYVQMLGLLSRINLNWPSLAVGFLRFSDVTGSVTAWLSFDCLVGSAWPKAYSRSLVAVLIPLGVLLAYAIFWLLWYAFSRRVQRQPLRSYFSDRMLITLNQLMLYFYSSVTAQLLAYFACVNLDDNMDGNAPYYQNLAAVGTFWTQDYRIQCFQGQHRALSMAVGIPGLLLFSIGLPLAVALFLRANRSKLDTKPFFKRYGFVYENYKPWFYWWEVTDFARLLLLSAAAVTLVVFGPLVQLLVFIAILSAWIFLHLAYTPLRSHLLNVLYILPFFATLVTVYLALTFLPGTSSTNSTAIAWVIVAINVVTMLLLLLHVGMASRSIIALVREKMDRRVIAGQINAMKTNVATRLRSVTRTRSVTSPQLPPPPPQQQQQQLQASSPPPPRSWAQTPVDAPKRWTDVHPSIPPTGATAASAIALLQSSRAASDLETQPASERSGAGPSSATVPAASYNATVGPPTASARHMPVPHGRAGPVGSDAYGLTYARLEPLRPTVATVPTVDRPVPGEGSEFHFSSFTSMDSPRTFYDAQSNLGASRGGSTNSFRSRGGSTASYKSEEE